MAKAPSGASAASFGSPDAAGNRLPHLTHAESGFGHYDLRQKVSIFRQAHNHNPYEANHDHYRGNDDLSQELVKELAQERTAFTDDAYDLKLLQPESYTPGLVGGILIGIGSSMAAGYITRLLDYLGGKIRDKGYFTVRVEIHYRGKSYQFPKDATLLKEAAQKHEGQH